MKREMFEPDVQRIIVLPEEAPEKIGSIIVPDSSRKEKPGRGIVKLVGKGEADRPMKYQPGERVIYSLYSGTEVDLTFEGEPKTYLIMNQADVWGKIKNIE